MPLKGCEQLLRREISRSPEDEDFPLVLGHLTERVQEGMDYVNKKHAIGQLIQEQVMAHLIML
jgi:hypothetical protein